MAPSNAATMKRIQREIRDVQKEDLGEITLTPSEQSIFNWSATIPGPDGSVYEGGVFKLTIVLPQDYPFSSPKVTFDTRIYHMNIASNGGICIDVLKSAWSPALSLFKVLLSISSLLTDPNPKDPLVPGIAQEYLKKRAQHDQTAREWTKLYAQPPPGYFKFASATALSAKGKGKTTEGEVDPEVIEVSSDVEILEGSRPPVGNARGRKAPRPSKGSTAGTRSSSRRKSASQITAPAQVAGVKRRKGRGRDEDDTEVLEIDPMDNDEQVYEAGGSSSHSNRGSAGGSRPRPSKRRAIAASDVIEID